MYHTYLLTQSHTQTELDVLTPFQRLLRHHLCPVYRRNVLYSRRLYHPRKRAQVVVRHGKGKVGFPRLQQRKSHLLVVAIHRLPLLPCQELDEHDACGKFDLTLSTVVLLSNGSSDLPRHLDHPLGRLRCSHPPDVGLC